MVAIVLIQSRLGQPQSLITGLNRRHCLLVEATHSAEVFEVGAQPRHACIVTHVHRQPVATSVGVGRRGICIVLAIVVVVACRNCIVGEVGIVSQILMGVLHVEFHTVAGRKGVNV